MRWAHKAGAIGLGLLSAASTFAIDHNNIDAGRPLRFDDAYSIAFRERAIETGVSLDTFRRKAPTYGFVTEYKYGFAKNQDIGIAVEPEYDSADKRFDVHNVELSYFHGLAREIDNAPALAYRVDLGLPTGRGAQGIDARVRGILTKAFRQYDRLHINVDVNYVSKPDDGARQVTFGAILGYSKPLGYPKGFDQTLVTELAIQQSPIKGKGYVGTVGIGLRSQASVRSVFDIGIETDVFAPRGMSKTSLRLTVGYSVSF